MNGVVCINKGVQHAGDQRMGLKDWLFIPADKDNVVEEVE
jgi:hypothetical protein